ncbi:unnamed protein product [Mycena citricolor]|uniref:Uncharacterized protein n=1 Tax=Mycena citricolor TaxID=2018698 RepID=A0AAD2GYB3_9AGAR|nr:unnamed protein product [Mycena citricolor]
MPKATSSLPIAASSSSAASVTDSPEYLVTVDNVVLLVSGSARVSFATGRGSNRKYTEINVSVLKSEDDSNERKVTVDASSTKVGAAGRLIATSKQALDATVSEKNSTTISFASASAVARGAKAESPQPGRRNSTADRPSTSREKKVKQLSKRTGSSQAAKRRHSELDDGDNSDEDTVEKESQPRQAANNNDEDQDSSRGSKRRKVPAVRTVPTTFEPPLPGRVPLPMMTTILDPTLRGGRSARRRVPTAAGPPVHFGVPAQVMPTTVEPPLRASYTGRRAGQERSGASRDGTLQLQL